MTGRNSIKSLETRFPILTQILGKKKTGSILRDNELLPVFYQLETDLRFLARRLDPKNLKHAYQKLLHENQLTEAVYEIHTAALVASASEEIQLKVPTSGENDCDFRIRVCGCEIYGEVKTRCDNFPFNLSSAADGSTERIYSRVTVDPHIADRLPYPEIDRKIPESTPLRQNTVEKALGQLPDTHPNLIVIGFPQEFYSSKVLLDITAAIFGDESWQYCASKHIPFRYCNDIFADERYREKITSVAWLALTYPTSGVLRRSGIFFNPNAKYTLPNEVELILERLFDREKSLHRELERIVEKLKNDYQPEKIILFGSLAQGNVNEGSDIDLAIIKDTSKRPLDRQVEVAAISQPSLATNFIIYTPEEFRKQQENGNFFVVEEILKRGEVLYER